MAIPYLANKGELDEYTSQCEALVLYFTAAWCGPCQAIAPVLEQLYASYTNVEVVKVDLDSQRPVVAQFQITAVPTFVFLHKGQEVDRLRGANVEGVFTKVKELSGRAPQGKRHLSETQGSFSSSSAWPEVAQYAGQAKILNKSVFFGEFEALNTIHVAGGDVKSVVRMEDTHDTAVMSDADSQLLLHVPLANVSKVSSILIKAKDHDDTQKPDKVKVWSNRSAIISFEDATSTQALHEQELEWDDNGWCELKLKYVRFQKVTSLDLFFDGDDEDEHTVVDKVLIVGIDGESKTQPKLEKIGHDD